MNKLFLFAVLIGAVACQTLTAAGCLSTWGPFCYNQGTGSPKPCNGDGGTATSATEYASTTCKNYISSLTSASNNPCWKLDNCTKVAAQQALEAKYRALCPSEKSKCANSDKSSWCPAWAKAGECAANSDWMLVNCANSCCPICTGTSLLLPGVCPRLNDSNVCATNSVANGVTCSSWATLTPSSNISECVKNPVYMVKNCMQSCCPKCFLDNNKCPTTKARCTNLYAAKLDSVSLTTRTVAQQTANEASCKKWAAAGECSKNSKWMMEHCSNVCCPMCIPLAPVAVPTPVPVFYSAPRYVAPVQYSAPIQFAPLQQSFVAPAPVQQSFGGYGAFGGYGGALGGSIPYRG